MHVSHTLTKRIQSDKEPHSRSTTSICNDEEQITRRLTVITVRHMVPAATAHQLCGTQSQKNVKVPQITTFFPPTKKRTSHIHTISHRRHTPRFRFDLLGAGPDSCIPALHQPFPAYCSIHCC